VDCRSFPISYSDTRKFSPFITDYIAGKDDLKSFYAHPVSLEGLSSAILARKAFPTDRKTLVEVFSRQYALNAHPAQSEAIQSLSDENTFTVTTAHQPNIFTGYLYLIYKILHVIRIAEEMTRSMPGYRFIPVYYIGSEDNDLDELGQIQIAGNKLVWETRQKGAVGRMKVDKTLLLLLDRIEAQLGVEPHGAELVGQLRTAYKEGVNMSEATADLINKWLGHHGLLVLQPDVADLKRSMIPLFRQELLEGASFPIVMETSSRIGEHYKTQIHPREINLFYLDEGIRERITRQGELFHVEHTDKIFTEQEILDELESHPERFSPNVVLRPIYQSTILPDVTFVGGGAELAYWMQLNDLFRNSGRPFPMLVLRNSFLLLNVRQEKVIEKLGFTPIRFFADPQILSDEWLTRNGQGSFVLSTEIQSLSEIYTSLMGKAKSVDVSLVPHIASLHKTAEKGMGELEKKLRRAEKRKHSDQLRQLDNLHQDLFPGGGLQERVDNILPYFARYGAEIFPILYAHSGTLEQEFRVITGLSAD